MKVETGKGTAHCAAPGEGRTGGNELVEVNHF